MEYPSIQPVPQTPVEAPTTPHNERSTEQPPVVSEHTEKPPSLSEVPYITKMLEIGEAAGHFEMPSLLKEINEFVLSEFTRTKMEDTSESYKEVVEKYLSRLNLPREIDIYAKIEHLAELMRIDKKLLDAAKLKEELLAKPISELTSAQLKKRIEEGK